MNSYSLKFNSNKEVINYLDKNKLSDIVIYIKGSRGMNLEEIKNYLTKKY